MIRMVLFRAMQEGLTNIHKHAAASRVNLWLQFSDEQAHLRIVDNGTGFDLSATTQGMGLVGVRERVATLGGTFAIDSRQNEGTVLDIIIPDSA
ncbi:MAG: ATP-binding protein [Chloroflexota bacterium]